MCVQVESAQLFSEGAGDLESLSECALCYEYHVTCQVATCHVVDAGHRAISLRQVAFSLKTISQDHQGAGRWLHIVPHSYESLFKYHSMRTMSLNSI